MEILDNKGVASFSDTRISWGNVIFETTLAYKGFKNLFS